MAVISARRGWLNAFRIGVLELVPSAMDFLPASMDNVSELLAKLCDVVFVRDREAGGALALSMSSLTKRRQSFAFR